MPDEVCFKGIELEIKLEEAEVAYFEVTSLCLYICVDVLNEMEYWRPVYYALRLLIFSDIL
jgi:hypothetical protein